MKKVLTMFLLFAMMLSMTSCNTLFDLFTHWGLHHCYDNDGDFYCDGCDSETEKLPSAIDFDIEEGSGTLEDPFVIYIEPDPDDNTDVQVNCETTPSYLTSINAKFESGIVIENPDGTLAFDPHISNNPLVVLFIGASFLDFVFGPEVEDDFLKLTVPGTSLEYYFLIDVIDEENLDIPMTGIVLDESTMLDGEGTLAQPYYLWLTHGEEFDIYYSLVPENATDASFTWTFGTFRETPGAYEFVPLENGAAPGFTMTDGTGGGITVSAGTTDGTWMVKGTANDGGGLEIYFIIGVEPPITE